MIGRSNGAPVSITGLGTYAPERVLTNDELAEIVDTSDEWITERTGIKERRIAEPEQAMTDLALPAARTALEQAGVKPEELDLIIVATVTPDMMFPTTGSLLGDLLPAPDAAAYDLLAGCTGFVYALAQAHSMVSSGLADKALVVCGGAARGTREDDRRRRRLRPAPGEHANHRLRSQEARCRQGSRGCKRGQIREYLLRFDPLGARRGRGGVGERRHDGGDPRAGRRGCGGALS